MTILAVDQNDHGQAVVTARSGLTGETSIMVLPMTKQDVMQGLADHAAGALIQTVFSTLTSDQREFLLTGITPKEWDDAFAGEDEEEEEWDDEEW